MSDEKAFRDALGLFPTGVVVVTTTGAKGERIGTTVSSFNSVSLSPPLVLFSIARTSQAFAVWAAAETYAINVLGEDQSDLSTRFARSHGDKWEGVRHGSGLHASILLRDALAWFECRSYSRYEGGDHLILVGEVLAYSATPNAHRPLVFYRGKYRCLDRDVPAETPAGVDQLVHGW